MDRQPPYATTAAAAISASQMPAAGPRTRSARAGRSCAERPSPRRRSPSWAVSALAATGSATVREVAASTARPMPETAAARITRFAIVPVKPWPSQRLDPGRGVDSGRHRGLDGRARRAADLVPVEAEHRHQQHQAGDAGQPLRASHSCQVHGSPPAAAGPAAYAPTRGVVPACSDDCIRAAFRVFSSSIAMVIGPTPPGTGVMAPATLHDRRRSRRRPQAPRRCGSCRRRSRWHPRLTISAVSSRGIPTAATSTSARRVTAPRSRVREWQTVTVAFSRSSSAATGLPTRSLRPTTTASAPSSGGAGLAQQHHHAGRRGREEPVLTQRQQPRIVAVEAVDVLARVDRGDHLGRVQVCSAAAAAPGSRARARRRSARRPARRGPPGPCPPAARDRSS